jgi:hypothetical protein
MDFIAVTTISGVLIGILRDYDKKKLDKHLFYFTRMSYYLMTLQIMLEYFNLSIAPYILSVSAPVSVTIFIIYYFPSTNDFDSTLSAGGYVHHYIMPIYAMTRMFQDTTYVKWYYSLYVASFFIIMAGLQIIYTTIYKQDVYNLKLFSLKWFISIALAIGIAIGLFFIKYFFMDSRYPEWLPIVVVSGMTIAMYIDMLFDQKRINKRAKTIVPV